MKAKITFLACLHPLRIFSALFILTLVFSAVLKAEEQKSASHHVIVMVDRSKGMQQEYKENTLEDVFGYLDMLCFKKTNESVGRPLLVPNQDYLSVVGFGLTNTNDSEFENYITTNNNGEPTFGYLFNEDFDAGVIKGLYANIESMGGLKSSANKFFNQNYGFPTVALPLGLQYTGSKFKNQQFNRTFIVRVSDKELNSAGVGFELRNYENRLNVAKVKEIDNALKKNFNLVELVGFDKMFKRKARKVSYKGKEYHVEVFELIPNEGLSVSSLLKLESPLVLKRKMGGKYVGNMQLSTLETESAMPYDVQLHYYKNGVFVSKDKLDMTYDGSVYEPQFEIASLKKGDKISVKLVVDAIYIPEVYPGTLLSNQQVPELATTVEAIIEKPQALFGFIPIMDWMMFANNQTVVNGIITGLIVLIILGLLVMWLAMSAKKPYEVSRKQFKIKHNYDSAPLPYTIDFNQPDLDEILLFSIRLTRNTKYILGMFEKNGTCSLQRLGIQVGDSAPKVVADNFNDLFTLKLSNNQSGYSFNNVALPNKEIDIDVKFFPNKIKFPFGVEDVQSYLRFDVQFVFQPNMAEVVQAELFPIELNLVKEKANPEFTLTKSRDFVNTCTYAPNVYEFGRLTIANNPNQGYAYPLSVKDVQLLVIGEVAPDYTDALEIKLEENGPFLGMNETGVFATQIVPNDSRTFLVSIDLDKIKNPLDIDNFSVQIAGSKLLNEVDFIAFDYNLAGTGFSLEKNKVKTELYVTLDGEEVKAADLSEPIAINKKLGYSLDRNAKVEILAGKIGNQANAINHDRPTSLMVKDFQFSAKLIGKDNPYGKAKKGIENAIYCEISSPTQFIKLVNEKVTGEIELPNQNDSYLDYSIGFKDEDFATLPKAEENKMKVQVVLKYGVAIKTPEHTVFENVTQTFIFDLRQNEGEEWLAIDFGTSAIVARYGDGREDNTAIDLQERHQELVTNGYSKDNIQEFDTSFLSSSMLLGKSYMEELSNEDGYDKLSEAVMLSPTLDSIKNERQYLSPYLKALIGFDHLPDLYQDRLKDLGKLDRDKDIIVTHIIKAAYHALFNKYLEPIIYDKDKRYEKNKIVLSVPNDFTLEKKELIKSVVLSVFPDAWGNYIKFVSESDAIAWYYASYYDQLIRKFSNATEAKPQVKAREKNGDTVLVYDMGAGTLDLTLFTKKPLADNNYELEILGKVGMTTGGNYLDTVLAEVAYDEMIANNGLEDKDYFHPTKKYEDDYNVVIKYKYFIKDKLKPALNTGVIDDEEISFTDSGQKIKLSEINLDNIKQAEQFTSFIDKVTNGALELLKKNLVKQPDKIESLVISGRGGQLYGLKDALMKAIQTNFNSVPLEIVPEASEMKSMVAKGALEYARFKVNSSNVFKFPIVPARYGYIIKRGAEREYHELIAPNHSQEYVSMPEFSEDKKGLYFEKDVVLNNVNEVVLVQTYYHDTEAILDNYTLDDHGNFYEASSVIYKLTQVPFYRKGNGKLKVFLCEDTEVFARLEADEIKIEVEPKIPSIIDIQNSSSFKRSMWPIV